MKTAFISIDVGTKSLRTALVTPKGQILRTSVLPIHTWRSAGIMEQSSEDIFQAMMNSLKALLSEQTETVTVLGIGVDTTASQVFLTESLQPLLLPPNNKANILGWFDHRAIKQSEKINQLLPEMIGSPFKKQIPEMVIPKLLWLQETYPDVWNQCGCILDLYDFLTWKLTGRLTRSPHSLFNPELSLPCHKLGIFLEHKVQGLMLPAISAIPGGLSDEIAEELGLSAGLVVATGVVDGCAGSLTVLGAKLNEENSLGQRLSMIVGTSSIYISTSKSAIADDAIWGPVPSVIEGLNHNIVGQSAVGALIDYIIESHPAYNELMALTKTKGKHYSSILEQRLLSIAGNTEDIPLLTRNIHVLPYFAGNRTPLMDMSLKGMISGLTMDSSLDNLALIYLATIQGLALEARQNLETLTKLDFEIRELFPSGGLTKNKLFMQVHLDVLGLPASMPKEADSMLLGGALFASVASGYYKPEQAIKAFSATDRALFPNQNLRDYYGKKYEVFLELYHDQIKYRRIMQNADTKKAD
ncbi:hypothetical protein EOPP23_14165 [Endozoicomonas sp. OPT23]|uniref:FGGY-family carbohydrate kinase n=1 Tax=Endozoicomonas sp. OPT23 TaxID=2072845 RepID=UPI00129BA44E|nr:FGGY-family carbohydrate kinase [Endozoicomonas sp. OPT23]MRI34137.1 hypothetical protein [Endozoicomonas sp. OPT23]